MLTLLKLLCLRFDYLHNLVAPIISVQRKMKTVIPSHHRLAITLRHLAVGEPYSSLSYAYRIGTATVSVIIKKTLAAIIKVLQKIVISPPKDEAAWKTIAAGFQEKWNLPHCLGALDGKHIRIQSPQASGSQFFNYKKFFSQVLLALVDADYGFIIVDVGKEGSLSDACVFNNSAFGLKLIRNELKFPPADTLPNSSTISDYFIVGDSIFQLRTNLMKPYPGRRLPMAEAIFNYRLSRARRVVENAFGILAARWRIFHTPLLHAEDVATDVVLAAVCLHNFIVRSRESDGCREEYMPPNFVDVELPDGTIERGGFREFVVEEGTGALVNPPERPRRSAGKARAAREELKRYVNREGAVGFQWERVRSGYWGARLMAGYEQYNDEVDSDDDADNMEGAE